MVIYHGIVLGFLMYSECINITVFNHKTKFQLIYIHLLPKIYINCSELYHENATLISASHWIMQESWERQPLTSCKSSWCQITLAMWQRLNGVMQAGRTSRCHARSVNGRPRARPTPVRSARGRGGGRGARQCPSHWQHVSFPAICRRLSTWR